MRSPNSRHIHPSRYHTRSTALAQILIQEYDHHVAHLYHPFTVAKETYDSLCDQYPVKWETSFSNEIGPLAQGVGTRMKTGNDNIFFILRIKVPIEINITYANIVCEYVPRNDDPYQIILTISSDKIPYPSVSCYPAATQLEAKLLFSSVISTPGYRFICADIKYHFLCSPMERFKYIKITFRWIPEEIRTQYNLYSLMEPDGYVYCEARKGVYGIKQAARLAFDNLVKLLAPHGYSPVQESPVLWKHQT